jgi:hypothetical protein
MVPYLSQVLEMYVSANCFRILELTYATPALGMKACILPVII